LAGRLRHSGLRELRTYEHDEPPTGVEYGLLLDSLSPGWPRAITSTSDLGRLVMGAAKITPATDADESANRYGGSELRITEERRAREEQTHVWEHDEIAG
jgi:hypothetical protein